MSYASKHFWLTILVCAFGTANIALCAASQNEETNRLLSVLPPVSRATSQATASSVGENPTPGTPATAPAPVGQDLISFTFERVNIRVFTQVVGVFTKRRIVVSDEIDGTITVVSPPVSREEAYALYAKVLESSGYTLVNEDGIDRVVRLQNTRPAQMGSIVGDEGKVPENGLVTRILHLVHVSADDMRKMLETHLGRKDAISVLQETNHLIITDTAATIRRIEQLVSQLDVPGMARVTEVIALQHADATKLARQIDAIFSENPSRANQLLTRIPATPGSANTLPALRPPSIVPAEHSNSIIVSGSQLQIQKVQALVKELDVSAATGHSRFNVIELQYLNAVDLAKNITTLLEKFAAGNTDSSLLRRISVEAVEKSNAIIVNAAPEDFREVQNLVQTLDVRPRQVHISVLIAEVTDGDAETLGIQLTGIKLPKNVGGTGFGLASRFTDETAAGSGLMSSLSQSLFGQGLTVGIAHGSRLNENGEVVSDYPAVFNVDALKQRSNVKILANPTLGAQNNTKAEVSIVDNIPMTEATISGTGADRDVIQNITRYDVGVKLNLTPHIIPGGQVQIELEPSIEAVTENGNSSDYAPTISKRSVKTTMTVPDGETIVIAGLSRTDKTNLKRKIPLLGDIPLLGWLFRWNSESEQKTNILIFVTPTVMDSQEDAAQIRSSLETRTGISAKAAGEELAVPESPAIDSAKTSAPQKP
ncbi:MAG: type II secretion system secretin GspD [Kiritimatiellia bacterium]